MVSEIITAVKEEVGRSFIKSTSCHFVLGTGYTSFWDLLVIDLLSRLGMKMC